LYRTHSHALKKIGATLGAEYRLACLVGSLVAKPRACERRRGLSLFEGKRIPCPAVPHNAACSCGEWVHGIAMLRDDVGGKGQGAKGKGQGARGKLQGNPEMPAVVAL